MTDAPEQTTTSVKPIAELFSGGAVAFWATTYNLGLALFNEYLLRRLGDPPLNVVVLADRRCIDETLASIPPERLDLIAPVNRRWLLRPVQFGTGRFHPKSYLVLTPRTAKLLVGSGNLSTNGLDAGREVFTVFSSGTASGDAAILAWRRWMRTLVSEIDDIRLAERFADLENRFPHRDGLAVVADNPLRDNLQRPLGDQFTDGVLAATDAVDELIATAPFYDENGEALCTVARRLSPKLVRVFVTSSTNVNGGELARRLSDLGAEIEILRYDPDRFTHAKLLGATSGSNGWLLSGSANLSHAALTLSAGPGNVELCVFTSLAADAVRASFLPLDAVAVAEPISSLAEIIYSKDEDVEPATHVVAILSATKLDDDRIQIVADTPLDPGWRLADHLTSQSLAITGTNATTTGPLIGHLVRLVDAAGALVSNHVVVDDPDALNKILTGSERSTSSRPSELTSADLDSSFGRALLWLHRNMVMDIADQSADASGGGSQRDESESAEDDDLWSRLERERLGRDPRGAVYRTFFGDRRAGEVTDPLAELLDSMRNRVPVLSEATGSSGEAPPPASPDEGPTRSWSTVARIRVRARNVLRRWAAAQSDPRLLWVDPLAPLGNLKAIASVFTILWERCADLGEEAEFGDDDLDDLWARWFMPFVGTGQGDGWLDRANLAPEHLDRVLDESFVGDVTLLCCLALRPGRDRRQRVIAWQPSLKAALDKDLIDITDSVATLYALLTGHGLDAVLLTDEMLAALTFIDDALWCSRTQEAIGVDQLSLDAADEGQTISVRIKLAGITDPLYDPRIPNLIVATRLYRRADSVALIATDHDWRLVAETDEPIMYLPSLRGQSTESSAVPPGAIEQLAETQGVLADLFPDLAATA